MVDVGARNAANQYMRGAVGIPVETDKPHLEVVERVRAAATASADPRADDTPLSSVCAAARKMLRGNASRHGSALHGRQGTRRTAEAHALLSDSIVDHRLERRAERLRNVLCRART